MAKLEIEKIDKKLINVLFFFEKIYLLAILKGRYILFFRRGVQVRQYLINPRGFMLGTI